MIAGWRLCRRVHADLSGEGARLLGGRWNRRGRALVYLADHPALAALEVLVHLDLPPDLLPDDYVLLRVSLPSPETLDTPLDTLPPDPVAAAERRLAARASAVLRVPSILVPHAFNLLLDPTHPQAAEAAIEEIIPFAFDRRLWKPG